MRWVAEGQDKWVNVNRIGAKLHTFHADGTVAESIPIHRTLEDTSPNICCLVLNEGARIGQPGIKALK